MTYTVDSLPDEILLEITPHLDSRSLKNARQVCNRWAKAGASRLFRRVYFAPQKDIMEIFTKITSEPAFAVGITELVYDARVFWRFLTDSEAHYRKIDNIQRRWEDELDSDEESRSALIFFSEAADGHSPTRDYNPPSFKNIAVKERSLNRYIELLQQQDSILDSGADFFALCQGLQHLVNLRTVSILDYFGPESDCCYLHDPLPRWYSKWSSRFFRPTFGPTSYNECFASRHYSIGRGNYDESFFVNYPWEWRGIRNCVKSLAMRRSSITHLHYGGQGSKLLIEILGDSGVAKILKSITNDLQCLKLEFGLMRRNLDSGSPDVDSNPIDVLARMLRGARQLSALSSRMDLHYGSMYGLFGRRCWPKLAVLEFVDLDMDLRFLKSICERHKGTLKALKLQQVVLLRQDGFGENSNCTWDDAGREVGPILQLSDLSLGSICEHRDDEDGEDGVYYLSEASTEELGYHLMSSVPRNLLKLGAAQGSDQDEDWRVEMWHETETRHENRYRLAK